MASEQAQRVEAIEHPKVLDQLQNGTAATLNNSTVANMQLISSHTWTGKFATAPPKTITSHGGMGRFDHLKGNQPGSKGGVMYTISSSTGAAYAIVLAWDSPGNFNASTSPNRVWGKCGPKAEITRLTWDSIKANLDKAGNSFAINDEASKICYHAGVVSNAATKMAQLHTNFFLM